MLLVDYSHMQFIQAGISQTTLSSVEGGSLGLLGGALVGGLLASPVYFSLINNDGICLSHHLIGLLCIGAGIVTGAMLGSFIGTRDGYLAAQQGQS